MKILFDQGTPLPLRAMLSGHDVFTVKFLGWDTLSNGDLLDRAEQDRFECFVTTDQNLKYQQNLPSRNIAIFVLNTTSWILMQPRAADIVAAISIVKPHDYTEFVV